MQRGEQLLREIQNIKLAASDENDLSFCDDDFMDSYDKRYFELPMLYMK